MIMEVNETLATSAALPTASYVLHRCDPLKLFHESQKKRHPLAAYNISISAVIKRFDDMLENLEDMEFDHSADPPIKAGKDRVLLESTDHLLDSLMEHMEDCEKIIAAFFQDPAQKISKKKIELYKKNVGPYRDHIGKIDNYIKHHQGRLRSLAFYDSMNFFPGYYIEGLVEPGMVGPVPEIHPGGNSAFSYARDLRFHIVNVYGVSRHLFNFINDLGGLLDPNLLPVELSPAISSANWVSTLRRIASLAPVCYPDEMRKPFPGVTFGEDNVKIRFPDNATERRSLSNGIRVTSSFEGDGVTRTFKLPYFGNGKA
jgi:hypothetical protein